MTEQDEVKIITRSGNHDYKPSRSGKLLNAKDMAHFAGISEVAFNKSWINDGCPCIPDPAKPKNKLYPSASVMKWRLDKDLRVHTEKLIGQVETIQGDMTISEADRRKKQADAQLAELKLSEALKLVANIEDLMLNFGTSVGHVTASLLGWRSNLTGLLTMKTEEQVDKVLDEEVNRILQHLKEYKHEFVSFEE